MKNLFWMDLSINNTWVETISKKYLFLLLDILILILFKKSGSLSTN